MTRMNANTLLAALTVFAAPAARAAEPDAGTTPKSESKPSTDQASPAKLDVGKYATGRLSRSADGGKNHYWAVDLAAGEYTVVLDGYTADRSDGHVGLQAVCTPPPGGDGDRLKINTAWGRARSVGTVKAAKAGRAVLQLDNDSTMAEYRLAVFKKGDPFEPLWLGREGEVQELTLGVETATPKLISTNLFKSDALFAVDLPEGDFRITLGYKADAAAGGGKVEAWFVTPHGVYRDDLLSAGGYEPSGQASKIILTAASNRAYVRVRAKNGDVTATIKVEKIAKVDD